MRGRELMTDLGWMVCAVGLMEDAARDGEVARTWIGKQSEGDMMNEGRWEKGVVWDGKIVFGSGGREPSARL